MTREIISRAEAIRRGLKRYFTGKPCPKGHISERRVQSFGCYACERIRYKEWYHANKEISAKATREWCARNPDKVRKHRQDQYIKNRVKRLAEHKEYYRTNREIARQKGAADYQRRKDVFKLRARKWATANPDNVRVYRNRRRTRLRQSNGSHTAADLKHILELQKWRCAYCRANLRKVVRHVDHIVPLSKGGANTKDNLQYLCESCNQRKAAKDPLEFARQMGKLI